LTLTDEQADTIRKGLDYLEERTHHYLKVVTTDTVFRQRTSGVGVMTAAQVNEWGVVGPTARASGLTRDVRVDAPYAAYADFPVKPVVLQTGDLEARFVVRIEELFESYRLIRELLDKMPPGELTTRMPRKIKPGKRSAGWKRRGANCSTLFAVPAATPRTGFASGRRQFVIWPR
jgi:ech hydrogenase subunit E